MSFQAQLVMLAWLPLMLGLFLWLTPQRAVVVSFIVAWLFLPQRAGFIIQGLPDYTRMSATCYGIILATWIFDAQRFRSFRLSWLDLPMLVWCICPLASSLSNGLGVYDGIAAAFDQTVTYGFPFFLGRVYFNNLQGLRQLAIGIFVGGIIYIPLCLFEVRMSPQLHFIVYGYHGIRQFVQGIRFGGYRPSVFMQHGLSVGMWMMAATLIGVWLWQAGALKQLWGISSKWFVLALAITLVLVKSTGAYAYFAYGIIVLCVAKSFRSAIPALLLIVAISGYLFLGVSGRITANQTDQLVAIAANVAGEERSRSLEFRLDNEEILAAKAREKPLFGWGGYGRNRIYEENVYGELVDITTTDSLWIIAFGINGVVGLVAIFAATLLPAFCLGLRFPARLWFHPQVAPAIALSVVVTLYMLDCLLNNQPNPLFTLTSGGIAGLALRSQRPNQRNSSDSPLAKVLSRRQQQLQRRTLGHRGPS